MLSLRPLQRALDGVYCTGVSQSVDAFVRPLDPRDPEAARREVVLVEPGNGARPTGVAVMLDPAVSRALEGERVAGMSRFDAWCLALEGVSHFVLLAYRADNDRPVTELELEFQAEVDKFVVGVVEQVDGRSATDAERRSTRLRRALYGRERFVDGASTVRGKRYRLAQRLAARYAHALERRYVRYARLRGLVEEVREFYRAGLADKWAWVGDGAG